MSYDVHICGIVSKTELAPNIIDVVIECKELAENALPGQFIHIKCGDEIAMPLRRPISICDVLGDKVRFIFEVKGKGTKELSFLNDKLDVIGPVGNPFAIDNEKFRQPAVIGGGIGTYPLLYLAKQLKNAKAYLGFRNKDLVTLDNEFLNVSHSLCLCTDDGSCGNSGFAVTYLEEDLKKGNIDIIYACGPTPMLKAVQKLAEEYNVKCQLSLEQRMGCGIGACLVCSCETKSKGTWKYKRVCKNGPVFWSDEVVL